MFQRDLHVKEEDDAMAAIRKEGGEILELTPQEHAAFVRAVNPIYGEARSQYSRELLALVGVYRSWWAVGQSGLVERTSAAPVRIERIFTSARTTESHREIQNSFCAC